MPHYFNEFFAIHGTWSAPGGGSKQFKSNNMDMILTWYHKKQKTLLFQGNDGNPLHEEIANNIVSSGDRFSPVSSLNTSSKSDN